MCFWGLFYRFGLSLSRQLGYKRPLTIWDFVWGIKYRRSRTLNKTKFQHFFSEMNKTNLPLASLCVFWAYFIVLGFLCLDCYYLHKKEYGRTQTGTSLYRYETFAAVYMRPGRTAWSITWDRNELKELKDSRSWSYINFIIRLFNML